MNDDFCRNDPYCYGSDQPPRPFKSEQLLTPAEKCLMGELLAILAAAVVVAPERCLGQADILERFPEAQRYRLVFDHMHMSAYERTSTALTETRLAKPVNELEGCPVFGLLIDPARISAEIKSRIDHTKEQFSYAVWSFFYVNRQNRLNGFEPSIVDAFVAAELLTVGPNGAPIEWSDTAYPFDPGSADAESFFARVCGPAGDRETDWPRYFRQLGLMGQSVDARGDDA